MRIIWNLFCSWISFTELCNPSAYFDFLCGLTKYITIEISTCAVHINVSFVGLKINSHFFFSLQNKYSVIKTHVDAGKGLRPDETMLDLVPILQSIPVRQKTFIMHATEYKHTSVSPIHRYISAFTVECTKNRIK